MQKTQIFEISQKYIVMQTLHRQTSSVNDGIYMWKRVNKDEYTKTEVHVEHQRDNKNLEPLKSLRHKTVPSHICGSPDLTVVRVSKLIDLLLLSAITQHDSFFGKISFTPTGSVCRRAHDPSMMVSPDADFGSNGSSGCSAWKKDCSSRMTSTREQPSCDGGGQLVCVRSSSLMETYGSLWRDFCALQRCIRRRSIQPSTRYVCDT